VIGGKAARFRRVLYFLCAFPYAGRLPYFTKGAINHAQKQKNGVHYFGDVDYAIYQQHAYPRHRIRNGKV
jgi:hypothetical protein